MTHGELGAIGHSDGVIKSVVLKNEHCWSSGLMASFVLNRIACPYCPKLFHPSSHQRHVRFCSRQHFLKQKTADLQSRGRSSRLVDDDVGIEPDTPESSDNDLHGEGLVEEKKGGQDEEEEDVESEVDEVHDFNSSVIHASCLKECGLWNAFLNTKFIKLQMRRNSFCI